jgi:hypothetical protein
MLRCCSSVASVFSVAPVVLVASKGCSLLLIDVHGSLRAPQRPLRYPKVAGLPYDIMDAVGRSGSQAPFGLGRSQVTAFGMLSLTLCVACLGLAAPGVAFNWRSDDQVGPRAHTFRATRTRTQSDRAFFWKFFSPLLPFSLTFTPYSCVLLRALLSRSSRT